MSIKQRLLIIFLLLITVLAQAADIQVSVDRNPVRFNESFQIIYNASSTPDGEPDFSPLQDNFDIVDQQRSSNSSWVNGHSSRSEKWIVTVMAKQAGELLIPPITFGADSTRALKVTVTDKQLNPQANEDLFLDVSVTPEKPYIQSQVIYTVRFYRRLQITQARLDEPQLKDAVVEKLSEDSTFSTQLNGVDYAVTERKYAIFPQQSGVITIPALTLTAEVLAQRRPMFNGFFNQQSTESRRAVSKAVTLNVQPIPSNYHDSAWLAAESLQLTEHWSSDNLQTKVGEPLTRTISLIAQGTTVGQLPELSSQTTVDGLKTYPDQPVLKEDKQGDGLTASREEKIAFIPSKPGDYNLPALEITWFNSKTGQIAKAKLPSVHITALANTDASNTTNNLVNQQAAISPIATQASVDNSQLIIWQGLSAFLGLGWLVTAIMLYRSHKKPATVVADCSVTTSPGDYQKSLQQACLANDIQAAKQVLLSWGKQHFNEDNLTSIAHCCDPALTSEILLLNQCLYAGQTQHWQGENLWLAFSKHAQPELVKSKSDDGLEPLYKL